MRAARLLIVDDDTFVRSILKDLLAPQGYELAEAVNGEDAVQWARDTQPDIVLLDLLMPKMSGIQALTELRKVAPATRVLVISSLDSEPLIAQAMGAGAAGFIVKPFHPVEIQEAVKKVLRAGE